MHGTAAFQRRRVYFTYSGALDPVQRKDAMGGVTLVDLGKLAKPATVLVEKICNAVGVLYQPTGIRRKASAEADAKRTMALADLDIADRTMQRLLHQEERKQANIESITAQAIQALPNEASTEALSEDWVAHFFKQCDTVSDKDMQSLWARLLAGEATSPGRFSKRTVDCVASFDVKDAVLFSTIAQFVWNFLDEAPLFSGATPLIYDWNEKVYKDQGINFSSLSHLAAIGLITYSGAGGGYIRTWEDGDGLTTYQNTPLMLEFDAARPNSIEVGSCLLTSVGVELFPICGAKHNPAFYEFILNRWVSQGIRVFSPLSHQC